MRAVISFNRASKSTAYYATRVQLRVHSKQWLVVRWALQRSSDVPSRSTQQSRVVDFIGYVCIAVSSHNIGMVSTVYVLS